MGVRTLIVGLAREGTALTGFLAKRGAIVTVTDAKPAEALAERLAALEGARVGFALGGHPRTLLGDTDVVFVSPGVPLDIPFLVEARERGVPLSSETRLFTRLCPAPVVGITGSSGKSTTTALVGDMLGAAGPQVATRRVWVGGNIGQPLIGHLDEIAPEDRVIMELSSFQLDLFGPWASGGGDANNPLLDRAGWSPSLAVILNITPNHLDRHGTMDAYISAKRHIVDHQLPGDVAVLNRDNEITRRIGTGSPGIPGDIVWFSLAEAVERGAFLRGDEIVLRRASGEEAVVCRRSDVRLLGRHNLANVVAACAIAAEAGADLEGLRRAATTFSGVPHRLELVRARQGVRWYNDSIATSPERTMAALRSFDAPIVLLAGGRDKHLPWEEMARLAWRSARHVILFGEAAAAIEAALRETAPGAEEPGPAATISVAGSLEEAVAEAAQLAQPGDVVLLSPGGTSFDAYADFVERGE
ncbi:MAG: UDP-N-acetylmuramoyl-L-alanine--D-glutamate ligase, partial [Anaerolineae bacterium]